jgi:hypothetical protein
MHADFYFYNIVCHLVCPSAGFQSREQKVYVSEFYRRVQTLLDEVDAMIPRIGELVSSAEWRRADELVWQAGVNLETSKNIMKAL